MATLGTRAQVVDVDGHRLTLTNLDKVLYPETGTTKARRHRLLRRGRRRADPARRATGRPPASAGSHGVGHRRTQPGRGVLPEEPRRVHARLGAARRTIAHKTSTNDYPLVNDRATLTWLAQIAAARDPRAAVAVRPRRQRRATPTGWCSTSTPARAPGCRSAPRWPGWRRAILAGHGAGPDAGDQRQQGHPPLRRARRHADAPTRSPRWRTSWPARSRPTIPDLVVSDMKKALRAGQGARRLEPEQRARRPPIAPVLAARAARGRRWRRRAPGGSCDPRTSRSCDYRRCCERVKRRGDPLADLGRRQPRRRTGGHGAGGTRPARPRYRAHARPGRKTPEPVAGDAAASRPTAAADLRHPGAPRPPAALRLPAGARRRAGVAGRCPRASPTDPGRTTSPSRPRTTRWSTAPSRAPSPRASTAPATVDDLGRAAPTSSRSGATARRSSSPCTAPADGGGLGGARRFALIHTGGEDGQENWLIHLMKDQPRPTGRTGAGAGRAGRTRTAEQPASRRPRSAPAPSARTLTLPQPVNPCWRPGTEASIDEDDDWAYEMKWDGIRAVAVVAAGERATRSAATAAT